MKDKQITEIERKFLIKYPDTEFLRGLEGCERIGISQTYLLCDDGSMRVRRSVYDDKTVYYRNIKKRISDMSHLEDEKIISEETYGELLFCRDTSRNTVEKTRYAFPFGGHIIEVDVYPFWSDRAVLEVELESEDEAFDIPPFISVIKEVTGDKRYSNKALAKEIVTEEL